jgi:hypothetical protein
MPAALILLLLLLGIAPAALVLPGPMVSGAGAAIAAAAVMVIGATLRPHDAGILMRLLRPALIIAALPAIWMLLQVLPARPLGLANPIWESAEGALGLRLHGSISIDPGATVLALAHYLVAIAVLVAAAAIALDRQRARLLLVALAATTAAAAVLMLLHDLTGLVRFDRDGDSAIADAATTAVALGAIVAAAAAIRSFERHETRRMKSRAPRLALARVMAPGLAALALSLAALMIHADGDVLLAVALGLAALVAEALIRRLGSGRSSYAAFAALAAVVAIVTVVLRSGPPGADPRLALADEASSGLIAITQRLLADATAVGSGAGTFAAMLPVYRDGRDVGTVASPPTAAAAVVAELGRPAFWLALAAALGLAALLIRGALRRGRDSFYPAAGAACLVTGSLLAFHDAGMASMTAAILLPAILGLALAQSRSRAGA